MAITAKSKKVEAKVYKSKLHKVIGVLSITFFTIWIIIGLLILIFIYANFKRGAFSGLLGEAPQQQVPSAAQAPTETDLEGVGIVNTECVQNSLSSEAIQKLIADKGTINFTPEENENLAPCIVQAETAADSN